MQQPKICTVVTGSTIKEFIINLNQIQAVSNFVELRTDYIEDMKVDYVREIKGELKVKAIFTCRSNMHGGKFKGVHTVQGQILNEAQSLGLEYIDVDLDIINNLDLHPHDTKKIVSYHDFDKTPNQDELNKLKELMIDTIGDIHKYAFKVNNDSDREQIYKLILERDSKDVIVVGVGELGRETRIIAPLLGSYLTFVSTGFGGSAPGQIDIDELKKIYRVMLS